jgi:hypothetical protein
MTYTYKNNKATATITKTKRYWLLEVNVDGRIVILYRDIWFTKRAAKEYAMAVLSNY